MMMLDSIIKPFTSSSSCCFLRSSIKRITNDQFRAQLLYLLFISFLGYLALVITNLRLDHAATRLGSLDAAFMSISAVTSSSMSTVEMEVFTNTQLIFFILLMFLGGEVFMSMLGLFLQGCNHFESSSAATVSDSTSSASLAELGTVRIFKTPNLDDESTYNQDKLRSFSQLKALKTLAYLVLAYLTLINFCGSLFVYIYMITVPSAAHVLNSKSISPGTFSVFLTTSSFANCGFVPTNENMAVFKTNSVLLLLTIPQVLMGNTLYPICIRFTIWVIKLFTTSKNEHSIYAYILSNTDRVGYDHLLSSEATWLLGWTGVGFMLSQVLMLVSMEWASQAFAGMTWFQRLVAFLFQSVSSRHSGESVVDLSALSTAVLVLFILMMYFPPYLTFMPGESDTSKQDPAATNVEELRRRSLESDRKNKNKKLIFRMENLIFSQLSYLTIFVILISITERKSLKTDPLNFNLLNILLEVISAYGNVGFSMGYSCKRLLEPDSFCKDKTYGFAGKWTSNGKLILIVVMIFGKLKRFNHKGGKAWKTL